MSYYTYWRITQNYTILLLALYIIICSKWLEIDTDHLLTFSSTSTIYVQHTVLLTFVYWNRFEQSAIFLGYFLTIVKTHYIVKWQTTEHPNIYVIYSTTLEDNEITFYKNIHSYRNTLLTRTKCIFNLHMQSWASSLTC